MEGQEIRDELRGRGHSFSAIAALLKTSVTQVSRVAYRKRTSHRIAIAIATALDKNPISVFPDVPAYHEPYRPAAERRRLLAQQLKAKNLIESRV